MELAVPEPSRLRPQCGSLSHLADSPPRLNIERMDAGQGSFALLVVSGCERDDGGIITLCGQTLPDAGRVDQAYGRCSLQAARATMNLAAFRPGRQEVSRP